MLAHANRPLTAVRAFILAPPTCSTSTPSNRTVPTLASVNLLSNATPRREKWRPHTRTISRARTYSTQPEKPGPYALTAAVQAFEEQVQRGELDFLPEAYTHLRQVMLEAHRRGLTLQVSEDVLKSAMALLVTSPQREHAVLHLAMFNDLVPVFCIRPELLHPLEFAAETFHAYLVDGKVDVLPGIYEHLRHLRDMVSDQSSILASELAAGRVTRWMKLLSKHVQRELAELLPKILHDLPRLFGVQPTLTHHELVIKCYLSMNMPDAAWTWLRNMEQHTPPPRNDADRPEPSSFWSTLRRFSGLGDTNPSVGPSPALPNIWLKPFTPQYDLLLKYFSQHGDIVSARMLIAHMSTVGPHATPSQRSWHLLLAALLAAPGAPNQRARVQAVVEELERAGHVVHLKLLGGIVGRGPVAGWLKGEAFDVLRGAQARSNQRARNQRVGAGMGESEESTGNLDEGASGEVESVEPGVFGIPEVGQVTSSTVPKTQVRTHKDIREPLENEIASRAVLKAKATSAPPLQEPSSSTSRALTKTPKDLHEAPKGTQAPRFQETSRSVSKPVTRKESQIASAGRNQRPRKQTASALHKAVGKDTAPQELRAAENSPARADGSKSAQSIPSRKTSHARTGAVKPAPRDALVDSLASHERASIPTEPFESEPPCRAPLGRPNSGALAIPSHAGAEPEHTVKSGDGVPFPKRPAKDLSGGTVHLKLQEPLGDREPPPTSGTAAAMHDPSEEVFSFQKNHEHVGPYAGDQSVPSDASTVNSPLSARLKQRAAPSLSQEQPSTISDAVEDVDPPYSFKLGRVNGEEFGIASSVHPMRLPQSPVADSEDIISKSPEGPFLETRPNPLPAEQEELPVREQDVSGGASPQTAKLSIDVQDMASDHAPYDVTRTTREDSGSALLRKLSRLVHSAIQRGDLRDASKQYAELIKVGRPDIHVALALLHALCHGSLRAPPRPHIMQALRIYGDLVEAEKQDAAEVSGFFDGANTAKPRVQRIDRRIYHILLRALSAPASALTSPRDFGPGVEEEYTKFAMNLLGDMDARGFRPDNKTVTSVLLLRFRSAKDHRDAFECYRSMLRELENGMPPSKPTPSRDFSASQRSILDLTGYRAVLNAFGKLSFPGTPITPAHLWLSIADDMRTKGYLPSVEDYTIYLGGILQQKTTPLALQRAALGIPSPAGEEDRMRTMYETVKYLHQKLTLDPNISPDAHLLNTLMNAYQHLGAFDDALRVFNTIWLSGRMDHVTPIIIFDACGHAGRQDIATVVWCMLVAKGWEFDKRTLDTWVECLCRLGNVEAACRFVCVYMGRDRAGYLGRGDTKPNVQTCLILLKLSWASGQNAEVKRRIQAHLPHLWNRLALHYQ